MKVVRFTETEPDRWAGKFGSYDVEIRRQVGGRYWRGPDNELVLETDRQTFGFSVHGSHSGTAYTLAGAMAKAETNCVDLMGHRTSVDRLEYAMSDEQKAAEEAAHNVAMTEAIEADRIAHSRGWEMAMDKLDTLKSFAVGQGLYPFPEPDRPAGPTP